MKRLLSLSCGLLLALASLWTGTAVATPLAMPLALTGAMPDPGPALALQPAQAVSVAFFVLTPQADDITPALMTAFDPGDSSGPAEQRLPLAIAMADPGDPENPGTDPPETA